MADDRVAIEILTAEGCSPIEIYRRVKSLHVEDATGVSSVRLCGRIFKRTLVTGPAVASQPPTEPKERVYALIQGEGSNRTSELCAATES
jgi:hypothetical protein